MRNLAAAAALLSLVLIGQSAFATTGDSKDNGPNVGSQLFFPTNLTASSSDVGGSDSIGTQLQTTILATGLTTVDILEFHELGTANKVDAGVLQSGSFTPGATLGPGQL